MEIIIISTSPIAKNAESSIRDNLDPDSKLENIDSVIVTREHFYRNFLGW
jgi:hypothetical protein